MSARDQVDAHEPPPLPGADGAPANGRGGGKVLLNQLAAGGMLVCAIWLVAADLAVTGDMLFQGSAALLLLALFVAGFSLVGHVLAVIPIRFLVGANLVLLLRAGFGYPLSLVLANTPAATAASFVVLVFALRYLFAVTGNSGRIRQRPWFTWKHLVQTGVILFFLLIMSLPYLVGGNIRALQNLFGDYIRIGPSGVSLVERVFEKRGHRVHLIGMMHIGEADYYAELKARIGQQPEGTRVILQEGVRDREGILPRHFASGSLYRKIADQFGLEMQGRLDLGGPGASAEEEERKAAWQALGVHFHDADVDISDLPERHRRLLVELFDMIGASSVEQMLIASSRFEMNPGDIEDLIMNGLIGARNEHLMREFEEVAVGHDEVYIPWGAAHLGDIERRILAMGYDEVEETIRKVVDFW